MPSRPKPTIVSCPGKVLVAGGYLVLDPAYTGFVVATPSRFYTVVQPFQDALSAEGRDEFDIFVRSPQFSDGKWDYSARRVNGEWKLEPKEGTASNPFVQLSLTSALVLSSALATSIPRANLRITIVGANDFYSQSREDATPPPPFQPLNCRISEVHKTGLGSSAAMTSSLCSALLLYFTSSPVDKPTLALAHNLSQYVHSLAQGKVGSGFDVSAAVWGSQVYRRFKAEIIEDLLATSSSDITPNLLLDTLSSLINPAWSSSSTGALTSPFSLPPRVTLLLADVDAGSNTPSMVSKVLKWRTAQPQQAEKLWNGLKASNNALSHDFASLVRLSIENEKGYEASVKEMAGLPSNEWPDVGDVSACFREAKAHILETRKGMRTMGEHSSVPIEPPSQTKLLDAISTLKGIVGAGVPGAGGYDAIWVLYLSDLDPSEELIPLLEGWEEMSVRPLSRNAWVQGGLDEGQGGLRVESVEGVEGLRELLAKR